MAMSEDRNAQELPAETAVSASEQQETSPLKRTKKASSEVSSESAAPSPKSRKVKKFVERGIVKIQATFNNTIVTITDLQGKVLGTASAGMCGFKGSRKSTPFAASAAAERVAQKVKDVFGMVEVEIAVRGPGAGFESAAKTIAGYFKVDAVREITGLAHNGCRPRKKRRV